MESENSSWRTGVQYEAAYRRWLNDPEGFWGEMARELHWYRDWDHALISDPPFTGWFAGGRTNLCYNAVDRHVLGGRGDRPAIIWESASLGKTETITYRGLLERVNRFARVLKDLGVEQGDRVAVYLPMMPEAIVAMLGCVRIGAIHVVVFTGYGPDALAVRLAGARPRVLVTTDAALRRNVVLPLKDTVDRALEMVPVEKVIVMDRGLIEVSMKEGRDCYWADLVRSSTGEDVPPVPVESSTPSHILYTAGETATPLGVVRDTGGYMVALYTSMKHLFDVRENDVFWSASDVGWVLGHSYTVYAPLLCGITTLMFEGSPDYPDHGVMWQIVEKNQVNIMYTAPTTVRLLRRFGIEHVRKRDISSLRHLIFGGEILDEATWQWATEALDGRPVIDSYWLTESGWPIIANLPGNRIPPIKPASAGRAVIGYELAVVDDAGLPVPDNTSGHLVMKPPLPPGLLTTLWGDDERYHRLYWQRFPGTVFAAGDYAVSDNESYLTMLGRDDDVLNVAAHRLSPAEIEEAIACHSAVAEACVVAVADAIKGEEPVALVVLRPGNEPSSHLRVEIKNTVRGRVGAVAVPRNIRFVLKLPKTGDGRYMKKAIRAALESHAGDDKVADAVSEIRDMLEQSE